MGFFSKMGQAVKDSYNELVYKVTWPTRKELTNSAVVVMIASVIIAIFVFIVDQIFENLMKLIYNFVI